MQKRRYVYSVILKRNESLSSVRLLYEKVP